MKPASLLAFLSLIFLSLSCGSANQPASKVEQDVYGVVNALLDYNDSPLDGELIMDELQAIDERDLDYLYQEEGKNNISQQDINEILAQAKDTTTFKMQTQYIRGKQKWIPSEKIQAMFKGTRSRGWEPLLKEYGETSYSIISKPLFSADRYVAVISTRQRGDWSASGATFLLKKINGKWKVLGKIRQWIS